MDLEDEKMTELGFLMDLFLEEELPKEIKTKIKERIKDVEAGFSKPTINFGSNPMTTINTQGDHAVYPQNQPSPIAQQALQARQEAINKAGKTEPGRTSPRKF